MDIFYLMHQDNKIAAFTVDNGSVLSFKINGDWQGLLPYGVSGLRSFINWLEDRAIPAGRYSNLGNSFSRLQFLLNNNSLSLSDSYWTCPIGIVPSWNKVNLYSNSFVSTNILDNFNEVKTIPYKTDLIPSSSLKGDLAKKWITDHDGNRILVKGSYLQNALQSVSEVLAAAMYSVCDINFVKYNFIWVSCNDEKKLGCGCKNFTSLDSEFIPAIDIVNAGKKTNSDSWYGYFIKKCNEQLLDVQHFMDVMLCIDFLIANNDRHLNNFGILRDPVSLQWKSMAPVFDSGNSLFYKYTTNSFLPKGKELLKMPVNSFYRTASEQLKCVSDRGCVELGSLPSLSTLEGIIRTDTSLTGFDIEERIRILEELRQFFEDFQNGAKIWSYPYQKGFARTMKAF